jgi:flagellin
MRINQNIMAMDAFRNLSQTQNSMQSSLEKLSSGYRINRAADDASGLVVSQALRAQISGLNQATQNAQDGVSVVQTADGALGTVHDILNRMRDLVIQSANTASSDNTARQAAQNEIAQLRSEIDRIAGTTSFGTTRLLDGTFGSQAARATTVITGTTGGLAVTGGTFSLTVDPGSGKSVSVSVTQTAANYNSAASLQADLQKNVSAALSTPGFTGSVTAKVTDLGSGVWSVNFVRNSTAVNAGFTISNVGAGVHGVTANAYTTQAGNGGVFQVGANVQATDQIKISIGDLRINNGTNTSFTALGSIDLTNTSNYASAQQIVDDAINGVSDMRGQLGAIQNRFDSTISNLQVASENLSASESRIRDTDMAQEMVTFTKEQILMQAGTAMLAQANQAPQSILKLLQ